MIRFVWLLVAVSPIVASAAGPASRVPLVMYKGQEVSYTTASPLLTVTLAPPGSKAVVARFDQYRNTVRLAAPAAGEAKVLCEYADNRIGEVLLVDVVARPVHDRYQRVVTALTGVEGLDQGSVAVSRGRVFISGAVYSMRDLQRCIDLEAVSTVCAVRLHTVAPAIYPELGFAPRASLELTEEPQIVANPYTQGMEGRSAWKVVIRFADVPVLAATSLDRGELLAWSLPFVSRMNGIAAEVQRRATAGRNDRVVFLARSVDSHVEIAALWKPEQGSRGETLARVPLSSLTDISRKAGAPPERVVAWWAAILQDAFRSYVLGERPFRTTTTGEAPLTTLYEHALRLRGAELNLGSAPVALARASFTLQFAAGREPFQDLLTTIPSEFVPAAP